MPDEKRRHKASFYDAVHFNEQLLYNSNATDWFCYAQFYSGKALIVVDQIANFAKNDLLIFFIRWVLDVSVLVSLAPLLFSIYQDKMIASAFKKGLVNDPALALVSTSQPIVSASQHVSSFVTAGIIFGAQNAPLLLKLAIDRVKFRFDEAMIAYIVFSSIILSIVVFIVLCGCFVGIDQIKKYVNKGDSRYPPNIPLTYSRFAFGLAAFLLNPLFQYADGKISIS